MHPSLCNQRICHDLYAEVPGIIQAVYVEEGDTVSKQEVLAIIERENIVFDVNSAEINEALAAQNLKGQSTKLSTIESELKNLRSQHQLRLDELYATK